MAKLNKPSPVNTRKAAELAAEDAVAQASIMAKDGDIKAASMSHLFDLMGEVF